MYILSDVGKDNNGAILIVYVFSNHTISGVQLTLCIYLTLELEVAYRMRLNFCGFNAHVFADQQLSPNVETSPHTENHQ